MLKSEKLKSFQIRRVSFTLCLAKTRERKGKRMDKKFSFTCLVCKIVME